MRNIKSYTEKIKKLARELHEKAGEQDFVNSLYNDIVRCCIAIEQQPSQVDKLIEWYQHGVNHQKKGSVWSEEELREALTRAIKLNEQLNWD